MTSIFIDASLTFEALMIMHSTCTLTLAHNNTTDYRLYFQHVLLGRYMPADPPQDLNEGPHTP